MAEFGPVFIIMLIDLYQFKHEVLEALIQWGKNVSVTGWLWMILIRYMHYVLFLLNKYYLFDQVYISTFILYESNCRVKCTILHSKPNYT
jgi:hypothetical protein